MSQVGESLKPSILKKIQIGEVNELEDYDHRKSTDQVFFIDKGDGGCSKFELKPEILFFETLIAEPIEYQVSKVCSLTS